MWAFFGTLCDWLLGGYHVERRFEERPFLYIYKRTMSAHQTSSDSLVLSPKFPISVMIVEDSEDYRASICELLHLDPRFDCYADCATAEQALELLTARVPDIILLDIHLPHMSGIEFLEEIAKRQYKTSVIVLSNESEEGYVIDAFAAGADGFIDKLIERDSLYNGILDVYTGGAQISPLIARKMVNRVRSMFGTIESPQLSEREVSIIKAMAKGYTYRKVAEILFLSPQTVRTHLRNIYNKLGVTSKKQAIAKVLKR